MHRNINNVHGSVHRNINDVHGSVPRNINDVHGSVHRNINDVYGSVHRNINDVHGSVHRNINDVHGSVHRNINNVHGSVHRKNILMYIEQDATLHSLLYLKTALHVSGVTFTHHQERIQLCLQHLIFVTPLLLPTVIVEELELV